MVEDNHDLAFGLMLNLEQEGYRATVATSGREALATLRVQRVDLVILDLILPGEIDGFEVLTQQRQSGDPTPVLVLSAMAGEAPRLRAFALGADDYVSKPFSLAELLARVSRHMANANRYRQHAGLFTAVEPHAIAAAEAAPPPASGRAATTLLRTLPPYEGCHPVLATDTHAPGAVLILPLSGAESADTLDRMLDELTRTAPSAAVVGWVRPELAESRWWRFIRAGFGWCTGTSR